VFICLNKPATTSNFAESAPSNWSNVEISTTKISLQDAWLPLEGLCYSTISLITSVVVKTYFLVTQICGLLIVKNSPRALLKLTTPASILHFAEL
jgi:hypothetical protein